MNYLIVSCIFDVSRINPLGTKRPIETYISMFKYLQRSNLNIILFTEKHLINQIEKRDGLEIIEMAFKDLPNYNKLCNINDLEYLKNYKVGKEYSALVCSKTFFIQKASELNPNYTHYIWIDSGISHLGTLPNDVLSEHLMINLSDKIKLVQVMVTTKKEVENEKEYLSSDRFKIAAGLSIIPKPEINWIKDEVDNLFDKCIYQYKLLSNEEPLLSLLTVKYPEKFDFIFSGYKMIHNLKYITVEIDQIIDNLILCRQFSIYDIGLKILNNLILGMKNSQHTFTFSNICSVLIEGQIISYYIDKELSKKLSLILIYLYHKNYNCRTILEKKIDLISTNLKYLDLDIYKGNIDWEEFYKSNLLEYIWSVL